MPAEYPCATIVCQVLGVNSPSISRSHFHTFTHQCVLIVFLSPFFYYSEFYSVTLAFPQSVSCSAISRRVFCVPQSVMLCGVPDNARGVMGCTLSILAQDIPRHTLYTLHPTLYTARRALHRAFSASTPLHLTQAGSPTKFVTLWGALTPEETSPYSSLLFPASSLLYYWLFNYIFVLNPPKINQSFIKSDKVIFLVTNEL